MTDIQSKVIIKWLHQLLSRYGCPNEIIMGNGPQFVSHELQVFLEEAGVGLPISIYKPEADWTSGEIEPHQMVASRLSLP